LIPPFLVYLIGQLFMEAVFGNLLQLVTAIYI